LHLALDEYDPSGFWPESRVFSIASSPRDRDRLTITYSVRGRFTARMERELAEGRGVWVKLPYGEFVIDGTRDLVLFAGGTGITAFTAFLDGLTPDFPHPIDLAYGARTRRLLIYRDVVEQRSQIVPQLHTFYFVERDEDGSAATTRVDQADETIGRLSVVALWSRIPNPLAAEYYLSGPPIMLQTLSKDLRERGVRSDAIKIDTWG
jgi:ferredoxin-NADP reductase